MQLKIPEPDSVVIWVVIGIFATWGGVVRLLLQDTKSKNLREEISAISTQVIVSGFTGMLGGLISFEYGSSPYISFAMAGIFGSLGDTGLMYIQSYFIKKRR
ncbi:phage holin family protein [Yersinia pestis]|uniref:phage holin family protein n=1 Tax=Yersinia pestis TaxID=632 RepID=UPI0003704362|nr:phage holin family protein [Yersinia pestis]